MAKIPLASASLAQLREFADIMGLEYSNRHKEGGLRALIEQSGWTDDHIELPDDAATTPAETSAPAGGPVFEAPRGARVKILIHKTERETDDVFVGVNGRPYLMRRGVAVEVPSEVVKVLQDAAMRTAVVDRDGQIVDWNESLLYPFSIVA